MAIVIDVSLAAAWCFPDEWATANRAPDDRSSPKPIEL